MKEKIALWLRKQLTDHFQYVDWKVDPYEEIGEYALGFIRAWLSYCYVLESWDIGFVAGPISFMLCVGTEPARKDYFEIDWAWIRGLIKGFVRKPFKGSSSYEWQVGCLIFHLRYPHSNMFPERKWYSVKVYYDSAWRKHIRYMIRNEKYGNPHC